MFINIFRIRKNKDKGFLYKKFQKKSEAFKFYVNPAYWEFWYQEEIYYLKNEQKQKIDDEVKYKMIMTISTTMCDLGISTKFINNCLKSLTEKVRRKVNN